MNKCALVILSLAFCCTLPMAKADESIGNNQVTTRQQAKQWVVSVGQLSIAIGMLISSLRIHPGSIGPITFVKKMCNEGPQSVNLGRRFVAVSLAVLGGYPLFCGLKNSPLDPIGFLERGGTRRGTDK